MDGYGEWHPPCSMVELLMRLSYSQIGLALTNVHTVPECGCTQCPSEVAGAYP